MEGRCREVRDQLGARKREVGRGWARLPDVLTDRRPDQHVAEAQEQEVVARREVAVLVEDPVVREVALAVHAPDLAVGQDEARVVEVGVEVGCADERDDALRSWRELLELSPRGPDEPRAEQQGPRADSR